MSNKMGRTLSFLLIFSVIVGGWKLSSPTHVAAQDPMQGDLVLWNKLGSDEEVQNSEVGADGTLIGVFYAYETGKYNNGYVRTATGNNYIQFPGSVLHNLNERGTVELWITPKVSNPKPFQYGFFALLGRSSAAVPTRGNVYLFWGDGETGTGLYGGVQFDGAHAVTPSESSQFVAPVGVPFHAAIAWDIDGIDDSNDTVRVYRDGVLIGSTTTSWNPAGTSFQEDFKLGLSPDNEGFDKFITDNLKVWRCPISDFSNRFNEVSPPVFQTSAPISNSHTALRSTTVLVNYTTYNEPINETTLTNQTFALHAQQTGLLTGTYSVNGSQLKFTPAKILQPGELVQISLTTATLKANGSPPLAPTVWQFRTAVKGGTGVFFDSLQSLAIEISRDVALGDVDGDGDVDAVVANEGANKVWLNNGAGSFSDSGQNLGSSDSLAIALGDVDGDGDLDAFVGNYIQANKVWLNNGAGSFSDSGQNLGSSDSLAVALGDVDGDGDLDVFVGNDQFTGENKVWLNDGGLQGGTPGHFSDSGQKLGNSISYAVALGDVDGDGDLDAFVGNQGDTLTMKSAANKVWLNNGGLQCGTSGQFSDSGQNLGNLHSHGIALGDVDEDGDLDAFVANYGQANKVWLNNGVGIFSDSGQSLGSSNSQAVALADIDNDGDLDAFVGNAIQANTIWLNQGGSQGGMVGSFSDSGQTLANFDSTGVALGDVDRDGDMDAFVTNAAPNKVWLNKNGPLYLPLIIKPDPLVNLYVQSINTGGLTAEVRNPNTNALLLSCTIGNNVTEFCGSFQAVSSYKFIANPANCPNVSGVFQDAIAGTTITRSVECKPN